MTPDLQALEAHLKGLRPAALDRTLLARLEDTAKGTLTTLTPAEAQLENSLRQVPPATLAPSLMARLEASLTETPAATTIVPFPKAGPDAGTRQHGRSPMFAAAAAVALLGTAAALLYPGKDPSRTAANPISHPSQAAPLVSVPLVSAPASPAAQSFIPAAFNTDISQARDEGVLWQAESQPRRVVKVVFWDRYTLVNPEGEKIEFEKPRVEYILVPEKID